MPESPDLLAPLQGLIQQWNEISSRPMRPTGFAICAEELSVALAPLASQITALQQERDDLREAASERDAIATLLSDRSEPGLYAKVEGLQQENEQLQEKLTEAFDDAVTNMVSKTEYESLRSRLTTLEQENQKLKEQIWTASDYPVD